MIETLPGDGVEEHSRYLAEVISGANDGILTTFFVVSGVAGAALSPSIVLVLGAANLFADGFSMGMSNYLSRRSEMDYRASVGHQPTGTAADGEAPANTALVTLLGFVVAGWAPLLPYILAIEPLFAASVGVTGLTFLLVGAGRSLVTGRHWAINGAEMLLVGKTTATVAFAVGSALKGLA